MTKQAENALKFWASVGIFTGGAYIVSKLFTKKDSIESLKERQRVRVSKFQGKNYDTQSSVNFYVDSNDSINENLNRFGVKVMQTATHRNNLRARPAWEKVYNAYMQIEQVAREAKEELEYRGITSSDETYGITVAQKVFEKIGGDLNNARISAEKEYTQGKKVNTYRNTCATKVSYALNNSGMPIDNKHLLLVSGLTKHKGSDGYYYYTGVNGIKELLIKNWVGKIKSYSKTKDRKDFYKVFYDYKTTPYESFYKDMEKVKLVREENLKFLDDLHGRKGIVTMIIDGWADAFGHTTLWDGSQFVDGTNFLNYNEHLIFVRELCFFALESNLKTRIV